MSTSVFDAIRLYMNKIHEKAALAQTLQSMGKLSDQDMAKLDAAAVMLAKATDIITGVNDGRSGRMTNEQQS